jgi:uncharacterized glyoxalase superfamily protein PhnB
MPKVDPIPEGFHTLTPHIVVKGCAEAIEFYKKAFGAEEVVRMPAPDGKRVMHAEIKIGDSLLMMADDFPEFCDGKSRTPQTLKGTPVTLHMYVPDVDKAMERATRAGARVTMPATDMFWGDRYGKVEDPYGHDWSLATHVKDLTPEELGKAAEAAFSQGH